MSRILSAIVWLVLLSVWSTGQPAQITLQGLLTDGSGNPVAGPVDLAVRLYVDATTTVPLKGETHSAVPLVNGVYSIAFGSNGAQLSGVDFSRDLYIGIQVGTDGELTPRTLLTATSSAMTLVAPAQIKGTVTSNPVLFVQNLATSTLNYAVYAANSSSQGRAVYGRSLSATGSTVGLYGRSDSDTGVGVRGFAGTGAGSWTGTTGVGVVGESDWNTGIGGYFRGNTGVQASGTTYGAWVESSGTAGFGLVGLATAATGANAGVWGKSASSGGTGVLGEAGSTTGTVYGVKGTTPSTSGLGVEGYASATSGVTRGVSGRANSPDGHAGYFSGGRGVYVYPRLGVNRLSPSHPIHVGDGPTNGNGAHLTAGGAWTAGSSRTFKTNLTHVDPAAVLERLVDLPLYRWEYISSDEGEHLGPMAEDFFEAFGLGGDERYISGVDGDGIALAAIQGLYQLVRELKAENAELRRRLESLEQ